MTYEELVKLAAELPDVAEARGLGLVCVRRGDQMMFSLKKGRDSIAIKLDWATRDRLLAESPEKYYVTKNYAKHPWLLVRYELLSESEARGLLKASWEDAPRRAEKR